MVVHKRILYNRGGTVALRCQKGSALLVITMVTATLIGMIGVATAKVSQSSVGTFSSFKISSQAQEYALSEAALVRIKDYSDVTAYSKKAISGSNGYYSEMTVSTETDLGNDTKQKVATINVYKGDETLPRSTLKVSLASRTTSGLPIGTIIAWASTTDPADGVWLECNGQSCSAYSELVSVLGSSTVPDYRGVFLRGYGSQESNHYGTVTHSSGALGELQGDAIRNIVGHFAASNLAASASAYDYGDNALFTYLSSEKDRGAVDNDGYGDGTGRVYEFNTSTVVPTADENRPVNVAVRYLIKAQ